MENIIILGAGGFAKELAWCIRDENILGFIDEDERLHGRIINDVPVLGGLNKIVEHGKCKLICGIGSSKIRKAIVGKILVINNIAQFFTAIAPSVRFSSFVKLGVGTVLCSGSILTTDIDVGNHVILNLDCTVGHDSIIRDYVTIAPGVHISGHVEIGEGVEIGTGANILPGIKIGEWSVVGAGAVVTREVEPWSIVAGVPAKKIKEISHD